MMLKAAVSHLRRLGYFAPNPRFRLHFVRFSVG